MVLTKSNSLISLIEPSSIQFTSCKTKEEQISHLIDAAASVYELGDPKPLVDFVLEREKIVSTGIGKGVALPHARISSLDGFYLMIGMQPEAPIDWNSIDTVDVYITFLILGPRSESIDYLKLLSEITELMSKESFKQKLLVAASEKEAHAIFKGSL